MEPSLRQEARSQNRRVQSGRAYHEDGEPSYRSPRLPSDASHRQNPSCHTCPSRPETDDPPGGHPTGSPNNQSRPPSQSAANAAAPPPPDRKSGHRNSRRWPNAVPSNAADDAARRSSQPNPPKCSLPRRKAAPPSNGDAARTKDQRTSQKTAGIGRLPGRRPGQQHNEPKIDDDGQGRRHAVHRIHRPKASAQRPRASTKDRLNPMRRAPGSIPGTPPLNRAMRTNAADSGRPSASSSRRRRHANRDPGLTDAGQPANPPHHERSRRARQSYRDGKGGDDAKTFAHLNTAEKAMVEWSQQPPYEATSRTSRRVAFSSAAPGLAGERRK